MGISKKLAADLYGIQSLSERDIEQLHTLIVDFFAAAYAGYKQNRTFNAAVERVIYPQGGAEESTVFRQDRRYPAAKAAFMNALYGHGAELDDGNKKAAGHAGVHLIPAVFALAEKLGSSSADVLLALATGYEAYIRISSAAQPGLVRRGFHSTGVAGTLACAAACARLYHLDAQGIEDAIALATTMTGGLLSYGDSRPAIKPLNPGKAAENGVFAAMLANEGMQGPEEALEGPNGWFHAVTDRFDESMLRTADHLLLHECYFKLYPSCRHTHCGIDAAVRLHGRVRPEKIEAINVYIYPNAIKLAGIRIPKNPDETKFSVYYTLARAFLNGGYGIDDMNPPRLTDEVLALIGKTTLIPDEAMEDRAKGIRGTRVEVCLRDGERIEETVLVPRGDPENPLTRGDILDKLCLCARGQESEERLQILTEAICAIRGNGRFVNPMALVSGNGNVT
ncbi:MAG: MmgE/PrpD family protein [Ruminococcaceae bacterium]|jgi:2-methylcitrate dehydratase PrpD|nr:MmgE/PrpD family protein [Oscillospiraceae bacterium]